MDEATKFLAALGPFSAPINVVLAWVIWWLLQDRTRILGALDKSQLDANAVREKRIEDMRSSADEFREHSEATQTALHNLHDLIDHRERP